MFYLINYIFITQTILNLFINTSDISTEGDTDTSKLRSYFEKNLAIILLPKKNLQDVVLAQSDLNRLDSTTIW